MSIDAQILSAHEVASRLDVDPSRVRAMARDGVLDARKIGGRWFFDPTSVEHRRAVDAPPGRPFEPANAWALIALAEGGNASWVGRSQRSRLRRRLREDGLRQLAPLLRGRARIQRLRAHPAALSPLREEPGVLRSGISAAPDVGADIHGADGLEAYVREDVVAVLIDRYHLQSGPEANVHLHVVEGDWPFRHRWWGRDVMSPVVIALDLMEAPDSRSRRAGGELLARARRNMGRPGERSGGEPSAGDRGEAARR